MSESSTSKSIRDFVADAEEMSTVLMRMSQGLDQTLGQFEDRDPFFVECLKSVIEANDRNQDWIQKIVRLFKANREVIDAQDEVIRFQKNEINILRKGVIDRAQDLIDEQRKLIDFQKRMEQLNAD